MAVVAGKDGAGGKVNLNLKTISGILNELELPGWLER